MASGVFSLRKVYKKQVQNVTDNNFASWPEGSTYGYYVGGTSPTIATIARLDFFNETASNPGNNYPSPIRGAAATSNNFYAYIAGGLSAVYGCLVRRLDFSNETISAPGNNLPSSRGYIAATSSDPYGYYAGGGFSPPPTYFNTITRLDFSNETISNPGKNLPEAIDNLAATSSNSYGYYAGGFNFPPPTSFNTITRLDFTNETVSNPGNNLPESVHESTGTSSAFYGYFGGGTTPTLTPTFICTIRRLDFSNETISAPGNNLPTINIVAATVSNSN